MKLSVIQNERPEVDVKDESPDGEKIADGRCGKVTSELKPAEMSSGLHGAGEETEETTTQITAALSPRITARVLKGSPRVLW